MSRVLPFPFHEKKDVPQAPELTVWLEADKGYADEDIKLVAPFITPTIAQAGRPPQEQVMQYGRMATVSEIRPGASTEPMQQVTAEQAPSSMNDRVALARWAQSQAESTNDARRELLERDVA